MQMLFIECKKVGCAKGLKTLTCAMCVWRVNVLCSFSVPFDPLQDYNPRLHGKLQAYFRSAAEGSCCDSSRCARCARYASSSNRTLINSSNKN